MTGKDGAHLLEEAIQFVGWEEKYPDCRIEFTSDLSVGEGEFYNYGSPFFPAGKIRCGFKEFQENWDKPISMETTVRGIAAFYHEACGHGLQNFELVKSKTPLGMTVGLFDIASTASRVFYGVEDVQGNEAWTNQYYTNPIEIEADYAGWYMADQFLTEKFDAKISNKLCCDGINSTGWTYGSGRTTYYTDIGQFFNNMEKEFVKSVIQHRRYEPALDFTGFDPVSWCAEYEDRPDLPKKIGRVKNGLQQAWAIAACVNRAPGIVGIKPGYEGARQLMALEDDPLKIAEYQKKEMPITRRNAKEMLDFGQINRMLNAAAANLRESEVEGMGVEY